MQYRTENINKGDYGKGSYISNTHPFASEESISLILKWPFLWMPKSEEQDWDHERDRSFYRLTNTSSLQKNLKSKINLHPQRKELKVPNAATHIHPIQGSGGSIRNNPHSHLPYPKTQAANLTATVSYFCLSNRLYPSQMA